MIYILSFHHDLPNRVFYPHYPNKTTIICVSPNLDIIKQVFDNHYSDCQNTKGFFVNGELALKWDNSKDKHCVNLDDMGAAVKSDTCTNKFEIDDCQCYYSICALKES